MTAETHRQSSTLKRQLLTLVLPLVVGPIVLLMAFGEIAIDRVIESFLMTREAVEDLGLQAQRAKSKVSDKLVDQQDARMVASCEGQARQLEVEIRHQLEMLRAASRDEQVIRYIEGAQTETGSQLLKDIVSQRLGLLIDASGIIEVRVLDRDGRELIRRASDFVVDESGFTAELRNVSRDEGNTDWFARMRTMADRREAHAEMVMDPDFAADAEYRAYPGAKRVLLLGTALRRLRSGRFDAQGESIGLMIFTCELEHLAGRLKEACGKGWRGRIVDGKGEVLASAPDQACRWVEGERSRVCIARMPSGEGLLRYEMQLDRETVDATLTDFNELTAEITGRMRQLHLGWRQLEHAIEVTGVPLLCFAITVALVACMGAMLIAARFARRIAKLMRLTEGLARGEVQQADLDKPRDELWQLGKRFEQISLDLLDRDKKLVMHAGELEQQVQIRTAELTEKTEHLEIVLAEAEARRLEVEAANRKTRQALLAKSDFLANTSHEIRTPMNGILGLTALLLDQELDPQLRETLVEVRECADSLLVIIDDILDLSKMEAGQMKLEQVPFELFSLFRGPVTATFTRGREKGLSCELVVSPELPAFVVGDPVRLRQVVVNLVSNAVKFTQQGSINVVVSGRMLNEQRWMLRVEVCDTGIGIRPERQQAIWDAFSQEDSSTTRRFGGTGLGLTISKQLVELMGGTIGVVSEVGVGSTFGFEVEVGVADRAMVEVNSQASVEAAPSWTSGLRVLLVEDNAINRRVAAKTLERIGCQVELAENGVEAVQRAGSGSFDLILMDCQMPQMDGFEATRTIRSQHQGQARVPIVALTANAMDQDRQRCMDAGMDDHLPKPFKREQLVQVLERYCRRL